MPMLFLVEVEEDPDPKCNTESAFIHSHNLNLEGIEVRMLPYESIKEVNELFHLEGTEGEGTEESESRWSEDRHTGS